MSDAAISRLLDRAAQLAKRARSCLRNNQVIDARRMTERAGIILTIVRQANLVRAVAQLEGKPVSALPNIQP